MSPFPSDLTTAEKAHSRVWRLPYIHHKLVLCFFSNSGTIFESLSPETLTTAPQGCDKESLSSVALTSGMERLCHSLSVGMIVCAHGRELPMLSHFHLFGHRRDIRHMINVDDSRQGVQMDDSVCDSGFSQHTQDPGLLAYVCSASSCLCRGVGGAGGEGRGKRERHIEREEGD